LRRSRQRQVARVRRERAGTSEGALGSARMMDDGGFAPAAERFRQGSRLTQLLC
jgi:hypothetical protein